ncbi:MAG: hypothetical protein LBS68_00660 [Puniceicoccales bacterium]|nr:hypothetical protein [Puniceicoccales bacterium]
MATQEAVDVFTARVSAKLTACVNRGTLKPEDHFRAMEYIQRHLLPNRRFWLRNIRRPFEST